MCEAASLYDLCMVEGWRKIVMIAQISADGGQRDATDLV